VAQASRPGLTAEQKRELWSRWKAGQSFSEIGRVLGRERSAIRRMVASTGGFVPLDQRRSPRVLSLAEREEISRGLAAGVSLRTIAARSRRAPSTISREIARHGGRHSYRAIAADERAWQRARRPKRCKLAISPRLRELVAAKLALDWSPQQISGWLARSHPGEHALQVSTETIYRSLFVQARGVLRTELLAHLRTRRSIRRSQHASMKGQGRGGIVDAVSIRERPAEAADRAVPGHWEGDLLAGSANSHIATLVERQTRYLLLVKVSGKGSAGVVDALAAQVRTMPQQLWASLTFRPRRGVRRASPVLHRDQRGGLLLRPAQPLAAGHQREHQRPAAPVLPQVDRPLWVQPGRSRRGRDAAQYPAPQDPRLPDAGGYAGSHRCVDPLNPPVVLGMQGRN
jgi:transposase, IS30 family